MVNCKGDIGIPHETSTVIIGNGPAALTLSFLLHGNVPYYNMDGTSKHFDTILDRKLQEFHGRPLYEALKDTDRLCEHFEASGLYTKDAWPVNVLLDTLIYPNADFDLECRSTIQFRKERAYSRSHVVFGSSHSSGGQWADFGSNTEGDNARTLSYSEQLSLPGFSFAQFHQDTYGSRILPLDRPRRPQVTAYYAAYPRAVGIEQTLYNSTTVTSVLRRPDKTYAVSGIDLRGEPFTIQCRHVILGCGLFTHLIEPPLPLVPFVGRNLSTLVNHRAPLLVVGSGFSAADAIIENLGKRPIIHLFRWHLAKYISPLKHCHRSSYPEYADIYKRMKLAAQTRSKGSDMPDYKGFSDCRIIDVKERSNCFEVRLLDEVDESVCTVNAGELAVLAGRRTSLDFLEPRILRSLKIPVEDAWLEKSGLRDQIEAHGPRLSVDRGRIICIGSITGDSLIKFMFGGVLGAAGHILDES